MSYALVGQAEAVTEEGQGSVVTSLVTPAGGSAGAQLPNNAQMIFRSYLMTPIGMICKMEIFSFKIKIIKF